ncbi:MAG: lactate utilization protein [Candidatus Eremiobacteraeota bacterium]|nr:lactate utilization protein [Candidatus Eremiobacteraeota bacterium]
MAEAFQTAAGASSFEHPSDNKSLAQTLQRTLDLKHAAQNDVDWQEFRAQAHAIKKFAIENLDRLLLEFEQSFCARGGTVLWASTREDAAAHVLDICRRHGATSVVKGKSMLSEEIELNATLEQAGISAVETDLGEYIVQLAGQRPSHIVGPALHLSRQDIGEIFSDKLGLPYTDDPDALMNAARLRLRQCYFEAGAGITGVNFAAADTGTVVVVENEGNGGLSASVPAVQIFLMGIEKVIPRLVDLPIFLRLLARAATGQKLTSYTHHFLGAEAGKHAYCVLVDGGRTRILADPRTRESLYCIRCGACLNVCPVYRRAGGWAYQSAYSGPIGAVITPQLRGIDQAAELPFASTLCGACKQECPVDIDLPHQLVYLRKKAVEHAAFPSRSERGLMRAFALMMRFGWTYSLGVYLLRFVLRRYGHKSAGPKILASWLATRTLPEVPADTFKQWWSKRR